VIPRGRELGESCHPEIWMNRSSPRRRFASGPHLYTHGRDVVLLRREGLARRGYHSSASTLKSMIEKEARGHEDDLKRLKLTGKASAHVPGYEPHREGEEKHQISPET